jgi:hypothetical protein
VHDDRSLRTPDVYAHAVILVNGNGNGSYIQPEIQSIRPTDQGRLQRGSGRSLRPIWLRGKEFCRQGGKCPERLRYMRGEG